jgi:hypothetical protein
MARPGGTSFASLLAAGSSSSSFPPGRECRDHAPRTASAVSLCRARGDPARGMAPCLRPQPRGADAPASHLTAIEPSARPAAPRPSRSAKAIVRAIAGRKRRHVTGITPGCQCGTFTAAFRPAPWPGGRVPGTMDDDRRGDGAGPWSPAAVDTPLRTWLCSLDRGIVAGPLRKDCGTRAPRPTVGPAADTAVRVLRSSR